MEEGKELNQVSGPTLASLLNAASLTRLTGIGVLVAVIAGLFLYAGGWLTPHALTPAALVNTFERLNGVHDGFRRNHAKGVCVTGYFESNGQGQALSKAQVFQPGRGTDCAGGRNAVRRRHAADGPKPRAAFEITRRRRVAHGDDQYPHFSSQQSS
jgi:catalase